VVRSEAEPGTMTDGCRPANPCSGGGRGWLHGEGVAAWEGGGSAFAGVQADGSGLQTAADVELNGQGIGG
jgi:hypothetical protein